MHCTTFRKINGPHLVVSPKSTLQNWYNEFRRFCPSVKTIVCTTGDNFPNTQSGWEVLITSYECCISKSYALRRFNWQYIVLDEAQRIKNENSKISKFLRKLRSENRLLLTGTPLQNNLHELWALLNYLMPDVFADGDDFDSWFDSDECLRGNQEVVHRLHKILQSFMLRRIKAEVEKSLLPKKEIKLYIGMTPLQREVYKKVLLKDITILNSQGQVRPKAIQMTLVELRKVANHPYLIDNIEPQPFTTDEHLITSCGKLMVLDKLLEKLKSQGSRVLLFSQFVIMLNILEDFLQFRGYEFTRLDGQTNYDKRDQRISEFNAENSPLSVFLLSTRAGGLGK